MKNISGLNLAEKFFHDEVAPLIHQYTPTLKYSAGLIGSGSEVLGFDDEMSRDHDWGPRLMVFLEPIDFMSTQAGLTQMLQELLPESYAGYATRWPETTLQDANHRIMIYSPRAYIQHETGIDLDAPWKQENWLTTPFQKLLGLTSGRLFRDDLDFAAVQQRFSWYPEDVWRYVLASLWSRIGEDEHLMGRAGYAGDEIGSAVIAARLVRDIMRISLLMAKRYPPYPKWLGTAFHKLEIASPLAPVLQEALAATAWPTRNRALAAAYSLLGEQHNQLGLTPPLNTKTQPFFTRPFSVMFPGRFISALIEPITDPDVKRWTEKRLIGNVDCLSDSTDFLEDPARCKAAASLWE